MWLILEFFADSISTLKIIRVTIKVQFNKANVDMILEISLTLSEYGISGWTKNKSRYFTKLEYWTAIPVIIRFRFECADEDTGTS